ncbi:MAG: chemotaxis protein CheA [Gammaproteobacteria bacterium]|nr:MAG: chemotaxis protein CheA [Gammaproteobacteria bacterium]
MAIDTSDEIVQDFLVESKEILESLSEQLVGLEQCPDDRELLNAVFRGFHTIKGGAGFLNLEALVEVCHITEDLFNLLRQGDLAVTPPLMDTVLQALDGVNEMFDTIEGGEDPQPVDRSLIQRLEECRDPNAAPAQAASAAVPAEPAQAAPEVSSSVEMFDEQPAASAGGASDDITDDEFEGLLDALEKEGGAEPTSAEAASSASSVTDDEFDDILNQLHSDGSQQAPSESQQSANTSESAAGADSLGGGDKITDDEFEALLDQLHGEGGGPSGDTQPAPSPDPAPAEPVPAAPPSGGGDKITDDEFEALLDEMHGKGKGPTESSAPAAPATPPPAAPTPEEAASAAAAPTPPPVAKPMETQKAVESEGKASQVKTETTVRVDTSRLDDIMNLVGELVLVRNRLTTLRSSIDDENLGVAVSDLELVTSDLQTAVMKTRMQPIKKVFGRFPRVVRDLARSLNKEIELELRGEETDLDKNLVEALADPLVHLVRNSVDHGIEAPGDRVMAGKTRSGKIILGAEQEGDHILLTITDDGGGMDPDMLRKKAVEKGLMDLDSASRLDDKDCFNLIFMPGFSTKQEISDISGRGVGMDVVKTRISQLNGTIDIDSELGVGTTISIKVPLTLAILPTLMVTLCDRKFALPMSVVREIFELDQDRTNIVDGQLVVMVRDKAMPIFFLERWLKNISGDEIVQRNIEEGEDERQVVTVVIGNMMVGFVVDEVIGLEEVVIKPLGAMLQGLSGLAGSTITGDGRIALIVDIPSLIKEYGNNM